MIAAYIDKAMRKAHYEIIDDPEPYYGDIPGVEGVWATGKSLERCREKLAEALEDWVFFSIAKGLPVPAIDGIELRAPSEVAG